MLALFIEMSLKFVTPVMIKIFYLYLKLSLNYETLTLNNETLTLNSETLSLWHEKPCKWTNAFKITIFSIFQKTENKPNIDHLVNVVPNQDLYLFNISD